MATTRKRSTTTAKRPAKKADQSLLARTGRTIKDRPSASAAIATGAVTAVAAAAAGAFFFSRSEKSFKQAAEDLSKRVKDGIADARQRFATDEQSQAEIAEEALTLKETGKKSGRPADPVVEQQTKAGAIAY